MNNHTAGQIKALPLRIRILVSCVALLFTASVGVVVTAESNQAQSQTPSAAPAEKTIDQTQKNIKVLNGLPESQLIPVMNFMGASLGVRCTFCHVNKDGKWDFVSDEKPEKNTAREMIKMVQGINKGNFKGNPAVSCFSCHRGKTSPVRFPTLPLEAPLAPSAPPDGATPAGTATPAPTPVRPTAEQILAKYVEALGGQAAIDKMKSRSMKGTWHNSNGIDWGYEIYQVAPDKSYVVLNTPRMGVIERGFNGSVGWEKSQRGLRDIESTELFYLRRYPDLFKDIRLKDQFSRISFATMDKIDGKDVYVLRGLAPDNKGERLFFDAQTGLLLRRITTTPTPVGLVPDQVDYADYRDVDGLKLPFSIRISSIDPFYSGSRTFTEIKLNVPVDETKFNKPPAPAPTTSPNP